MKNDNKVLASLITLVIIVAFLYIKDGGVSYADSINDTKPVVNVVDADKVNIEFIDVGQADSILIQTSNSNILIDAGNNEDGKRLVKYLNEKGIDEFKYVVGTHPHEDHIGGMDDIINNFKIDTFMMPDAITTTKTFEEILDALDNKNMKLTVPEIDSEFIIDDLGFKVLYTGTDVKDLNNTSIVLKMTHFNNSFLFTGDATSKVEKLILNKDIKADLLKVGHHGSQYSSTDAFLDKVNPKYAVICVGKNNTYDHPKDVTLNKLKERNVKIYRTDLLGTIKVISDGNNLEFSNFQTDTNG